MTGEENIHAWILNNVYTTSMNPIGSPKEHYVQQALEKRDQVKSTLNKDKEKVKRDLFNDKVE